MQADDLREAKDRRMVIGIPANQTHHWVLLNMEWMVQNPVQESPTIHYSCRF